MKSERLPWMKFYLNDWLSDAALRTCSLAARGLWIDMLCLMQQTEPRGYLQNGDKIITKSDLKVIENLHKTRLKHLLNELETHRVFSVDADGCIYSRRLVHDEYIRSVRKQAGSKGGLATAKEHDLPQQKSGVCYSPEAEIDTEAEQKGIDSEDNTYPLPPASEAPPSIVETEAFKAWYEAYPRDIGRGKCWKHWYENRLEGIADKIMVGLKRWKVSKEWHDRNPEYPLKWLRETMWKDHPKKHYDDSPNI